MKLQVSKSQNSTTYYVAKSFRNEAGKITSKIVERLGSLDDIKVRAEGEEPLEWAKNYVKELTRQEKDENRKVSVEYSATKLLDSNVQRCYNGGYLGLEKIYYELGIDKICEKISKKYKFEYDLNEILEMLLYTRIIYPGSKLAATEDAQRFIEQPHSELHQVYRALSLLAKESDDIQASVYKNSLKLGQHRSKVIYYDCTNYFFESETEDGFRQYGPSKEHRPNPIVQMGLFMDTEGFPLAFSINPGNTNEQITLKPLEKKLKDNFDLSKVVVCTDCGLSSYENRKNDDVGERAFITVQSLKKLKNHLQEWALNTDGWKVRDSEKVYDLSTLDADAYKDTLFYKDRWMNENGLEQRIIVTFSFKYKEYLAHIREKQIERAANLIQSGSSRINKKNATDCKRFILQTHCTTDGEVAQKTSLSLNQEMIEQEARFDGFYAICTDLEDNALDIIGINSGRWIIENAFRIMKTEFEARPVFLQRRDRIETHFLTCFLALLLYKNLEKKINRGRNHFTTDEIINTLIDMNFLMIEGEGYVPTYTRTNLTNALHGASGFRTDTQIVTKKEMRKIISRNKNKRQKKDDVKLLQTATK